MPNDLKLRQKDWSIFVRLSRISLAGGQLGSLGSAELHRLRDIYPDWKAGGERDDFAVWSELSVGSRGNAGAMTDVPTAKLLPAVREMVAKDEWNNEGLWGRIVETEPFRSFEALAEAARAGDWRAGEWRQLFNHLLNTDDRPLHVAVFEFLESHSLTPLTDAAHSIVQWLSFRFERLRKFLGNRNRLLSLWDRLAGLSVSDSELYTDFRDDPMFAALNEIPGMLAQILLAELQRRKVPRVRRLPADLRGRFDSILSWEGDAGLIGQVPLVENITFLDYRDAVWTHANLVPLLSPDAPNADVRWIARFHSSILGSPELFKATREGFWSSFDITGDGAWKEGQVFMLLQAAQRKILGGAYDIQPQEAKAALLKGGEQALVDCARYLIVSAADPAQRAENWRTVSKPLLEFVWPGDAKAQSDRATAFLLDLALASDAEFPDAVRTIVPRISPAWVDDWSFEGDFDENGRDMLRRFPEAGLELLDVLIPVDRGPTVLNELLDIIADASPDAVNDFRFIRLRGLARRLAS
jgi:hypothetical protein